MLIHSVSTYVCRKLACIQGSAWRARSSLSGWPQVTQLVGFQPPGMSMEAHVQMQQLQVCVSAWQWFDCWHTGDPSCLSVCNGCCTSGISTP